MANEGLHSLDFLHYDTKLNKIVEPVKLDNPNLPDPLTVNDLNVLNVEEVNIITGNGFRGDLTNPVANDVLFDTSVVVGDAFNIFCQVVQEINGPENPANNEFTATIAGTVMTVSAVTSGAIQVGSIITGVGVLPLTEVTSFGTGTGGVGTYNVNNAQAVGPITINAALPGQGIAVIGDIVHGTSGELIRCVELQNVNNISGYVKVPFLSTSDIEEVNADEGLLIRPNTTFETNVMIPKLTTSDINGTIPIDYTPGTGTFQIAETIVGSVSTARGTILTDIANQLIVSVTLNGPFQNGETVTGVLSGATGTAIVVNASLGIQVNNQTTFVGGTAGTPDAIFANHIAFGGGDLYSYDEDTFAVTFQPDTGSSTNDFALSTPHITRNGAMVMFTWQDSSVTANADVFNYYIAAPGTIPAFYRPIAQTICRISMHRDVSATAISGGHIIIEVDGSMRLFNEADDRAVAEGWSQVVTDNGKFVGVFGGFCCWQR